MRTAREVDKPLRWTSQTSTPPDKSTNRPLYQGADGNACREGRVWYVATYYACLLLKDGTGGESEGGFHLFVRQPCKPQSRVWSNSNSSWGFDTRGLQRSKILPVTYRGWASSSFSVWMNSITAEPEQTQRRGHCVGAFHSSNLNFFFTERNLSILTCWWRWCLYCASDSSLWMMVKCPDVLNRKAEVHSICAHGSTLHWCWNWLTISLLPYPSCHNRSIVPLLSMGIRHNTVVNFTKYHRKLLKKPLTRV